MTPHACYSSSTYLNVRFSMAIMLKRKARSRLISENTLRVAKSPTILFVALTDEISTGMHTGKSKKDKSRVFPSENITSPEMKDPAKARSTAPRIKITKKSWRFEGSLRFKNTIENGSNTASISKSRAIAYKVFPSKIENDEQGRVFKPPKVPRSISLLKDVVKVNTLAKKMTIQRAAETTSGLVVMAPPQAKLSIKTELTENVRIDRIS